MQRELRELSKPATERPPVDLKKIYLRVGLVLAVIWAVAIIIPTWIPKAIAGVITLVVVGAGVWVMRQMNKSQQISAIMAGAETEEGRKEALGKLQAGFGKGDAQALMARAQLEMQEDPRAALATLESIDLAKQMGPVASQVRATRAQIHLMLGDVAEARTLADALDLGKQDDAKLRAMFANPLRWGRRGPAPGEREEGDRRRPPHRGSSTPRTPEFNELRAQMWRARAFARHRCREPRYEGGHPRAEEAR